MTLTCIQQFGNFVPGDVVTVPDGSVFDQAYFQEAAASQKPAVKQAKEGD